MVNRYHLHQAIAVDFIGTFDDILFVLQQFIWREKKLVRSKQIAAFQRMIKMMQPVRENTDELVRLYKEAGIDLTYEINPGNHFTDVIRRTAKGIRAVL